MNLQAMKGMTPCYVDSNQLAEQRFEHIPIERRESLNIGAISQQEAYSLMLKEYPDVLNIDQLCEVLCVSTKTGYRLLRDGDILSLKVGRTYRIPKAHLLSYLKIGMTPLEPS